jgi:DNA-binding CsgD family transcriptional regulator
MAIFPDIIAMSLANLARIESALGDDDKAQALIEEGLSIAEGGGEPFPAAITAAGVGESWPAAVTKATAAVLAYRRGDTADTERLAHEALSTSHALGYDYWPNGTIGCLETIAMVADDHHLAARLLGAVDAAYERSERVRPALDQGWRDSAAERLQADIGEDAFRHAYEEGRILSLDEAVGYARRGRGRRKRPSTGWESLTPTELEVVKLVAEGLSNPQIAERMFISRKTVTTHLTHVFSKLGLPSRAALSAEAVRREKGATQ